MDYLLTKNMSINQFGAAQMLSSVGVQIDPVARTVCFRGELVKLPRYEFEILQHLIAHNGKVVSREKLAQSLYGEEDVDSNILDVYVHNLRKKFGAQAIRTIRGVGYVTGLKIISE